METTGICNLAARCTAVIRATGATTSITTVASFSAAASSTLSSSTAAVSSRGAVDGDVIYACKRRAAANKTLHPSDVVYCYDSPSCWPLQLPANTAAIRHATNSILQTKPANVQHPIQIRNRLPRVAYVRCNGFRICYVNTDYHTHVWILTNNITEFKLQVTICIRQ